MSTLGNKKVELFDMGAGVSEPTADDNFQVASGETYLPLDLQITSHLFDIITWAKQLPICYVDEYVTYLHLLCAVWHTFNMMWYLLFINCVHVNYNYANLRFHLSFN